MILDRVKSIGLAHISYFVGSENEAVIIDPRRDCLLYTELALREAMKITHIFETHRNEDYVSGAIELSHTTQATIHHGSDLDFKYGKPLKDGQSFSVGKLKLTAMHTPGHTDESVSYVLSDPSLKDDPIMVFTGDTLFVGDVGRIDLYGPKEAPRLAENLYHSIHDKILPLGDEVILCPAHGAGSVCGGAISEREYSTVGFERRHNPRLQESKKEFIKIKTQEHHERPPYFRTMEQYNLTGPPLLRTLPNPSPLSPKEFQQWMAQGAVILDTRLPIAFGGAHIKSSYNIWLEGLPMFAGWVLPYDQPILLVLDNKNQLDRGIRYLIRLGYDRIAGYLCNGINACGLKSWYVEGFPLTHSGLLTVQELKTRLDLDDQLIALDVRSNKEWKQGHIDGARHIYVGHLKTQVDQLPVDQPIAVICSVEVRASLGTSILRRLNRQKIYTVLGGMTAWEKAD